MDSSQQRGRVAEAMCIAYLTQLGWDVFVGFGNTQADLVAVRNGTCVRVEVKAYGHDRSVPDVYPDRFDALLCVTPSYGVIEETGRYKSTGPVFS